MQMISNNSAFGCKNVTDGLYLSWKVDSNTQSIIGRGGGEGGDIVLVQWYRNSSALLTNFSAPCNASLLESTASE